MDEVKVNKERLVRLQRKLMTYNLIVHREPHRVQHGLAKLVAEVDALILGLPGCLEEDRKYDKP